MSKNDKAWGVLFEKYNIIQTVKEYGFFEISAKDINIEREARLMTKFDHKSNLPKIFEDNRLSILPVTRGSYIISNFQAYNSFENITEEIIKVKFPDYITSIDYENITSEAMAINCAYVSGILSDFIGDKKIIPTVNGRMSSGKFKFKIDNIENKNIMDINVENSQIEIDGGYEGVDSLSLIEAKNVISDDFIIRQLYYPFRLWSEKVNKEVKSIFMVYSNGIYNLYEYKFEDIDKYNSIKLVKQKNYTIEDFNIEMKDIVQVLNELIIVREPEIPFPQANSFNRVINLCELLNINEMSKEEITMNYDFNPRQTNYYTDAGRYLGLIDKKKDGGVIKYFLTKQGKNLFKLKYRERQIRYVELILSHKPFNDSFKIYLQKREVPNISEVVKVMKKSGVYNVKSENTYVRRASTINGWLNWIIQLTKI